MDNDNSVSPLEALRGQLYEFTSLKEHAGWKRLLEYARAQISFRSTSVIRSPRSGLDDLVANEYPRGELAGIELFCAIPDVEIARLKEEIEMIISKMQQTGGENEHVDPKTEQPSP